MFLRELKDRVMQLTGGAYRDQQHMRVLLNDAVMQMAGDAKLQAKQTVTTVPGTSRYPLPDDFKSPIALTELESPSCSYPLIDPLDGGYGFGVYGDELVISPVPGSAVTLNLYYYAYPPEMVTETDKLPIDDRYAQAVASYAAAMILALPNVGGSQGLIERYFAVWDDAKRRFKIDMQKRHKQASVRKVARNW